MKENTRASSPPYAVLDLRFQGLPGVIGAFLLPTAEGWVLVESGPHSCWDALVRELAERGLKPRDIRHVLLTHIHLDHAGAAWALAAEGAQVHVHPFGRDHLADPSRLMASAQRIYGEEMDALWGEMHPVSPSLLHSIDDQDVLDIGGVTFKAHHTPGHASHHIAWQTGDILFTGDVAGIRIGSGVVAPPCPPPEFDPELWAQSLARMRSLDVRELVLTHFGPVQDIGHHFLQLEEGLSSWMNFFRDQPDTAEPEDLVPAFTDFIEHSFYPPSMDAASRKQYAFANPPWMSVAGILRYLRKSRRS